MEELLDMIVADESPSQISDAIKDLLFAKTAEKVDAFRPTVAGSVLGSTEVESETEVSSEEEE